MSQNLIDCLIKATKIGSEVTFRKSSTDCFCIDVVKTDRTGKAIRVNHQFDYDAILAHDDFGVTATVTLERLLAGVGSR